MLTYGARKLNLQKVLYNATIHFQHIV